jgi:hypothetical protein
MQMRYFRRSALAGKSLKRLTSAQVRGNLRRLDIDQFSSVPYFPGVTQGDTLTVEGVTVGVPTEATVGITATPQGRADFNEAIASLTAGLVAINVKAFDDGGCIGLKSTLSGSLGRVKITGGTAAKALGFDLTAQDFFSIGGDLVSSPEGRGLGQPYGAVGAVPGENLTSDAYSRALGRVMANTDVLFSDLMKQEVVMKKVATVTSSPAPLSSILLGETKVYIGGQNTKEDLAHLFVLIDTATGQPTPSKVTGVWNSLGTIQLNAYDQTIVAGTTINEILNGEVVRCDGGNFLVSGAVAGDYVEIYSAGNLTPFSNNGYRWVVDRVIDAQYLAIRPMSTAELASVGQDLDDSQPITELNSTNSGAWGSLRVKRGKFATGARLVLSTPIPLGMTVDVWAPVPVTMRDRALDALAQRGYGVFSSSSHDFDHTPNALLTRPLIFKPGGLDVVRVAPFMVRWHGRPIRVPQPPDFTFPETGTTHYLYWDEYSCAVLKTNVPAGFSFTESRTGTATTEEIAGKTPNTNGKGIHLATVTTNGAGQVLAVTPTGRIVADQTLQMTVGHGAQFYTLGQALEHVRRQAVSGLAATAKSQVEIVIVTDQTAPAGGWQLPPTGILIRSGSPSVQLIAPVSGPYFTSQAGTVLMLSGLKADFARVLVSGTAPWWVSDLVDSGSGGLGRSLWKSYDTNQEIDIGPSTSSLYFGKTLSGFCQFRNQIQAAYGIYVSTPYVLQIGAVANNFSGLTLSAADGLRISKVGGDVRTLNWDSVDAVLSVLLGGPTVNADARHIHKALQSEFTIGGVATGPSVTAANLSTLTNGSNTALHNHNHGNQLGGALHDAVTSGSNGFMLASDKVKLDALAADSLLVHRAGAETITGAKTFSANQILDVAEAALDAASVKHITRRSYVRRLAQGPFLPIMDPTTYTTDSKWLTWAGGQVEIGTSPGPGRYLSPGTGCRNLLIGTTPGNVGGNRNLAYIVPTPYRLPLTMPLGRRGNPCKLVIRASMFLNDAGGAIRVFVNNTLVKPTDRAANVVTTAFTNTTEWNQAHCWREYFNLHGGYNGSGFVTFAEAEALVSACNTYAESGAAHTFEVQVDIDPDSPIDIAIDVYGVSKHGADAGGNISWSRISIGAIDPELNNNALIDAAATFGARNA